MSALPVDLAPALCTIIAALRYYQENGQGDPSNRSCHIHDIATNCEEGISLDAEGIDALCQALNFGAIRLVDTTTTSPRSEDEVVEAVASVERKFNDIARDVALAGLEMSVTSGQRKAANGGGYIILEVSVFRPAKRLR